jgi:hypothetical protein
MFRIREVDGNDDDISDTLGELALVCWASIVDIGFSCA